MLHNLAIIRNVPLIDDWDEGHQDDVRNELEAINAAQGVPRDVILRRLGNEKRKNVAINTFGRR